MAWHEGRHLSLVQSLYHMCNKTWLDGAFDHRSFLYPSVVSGPDPLTELESTWYNFQGNKYAIVFVDYLTKWVEVFPTPDQSALTIARLLVSEIISRHGVPRELLSDRGAAFLSKLLHEVYRLMGIHKVSTIAYHPTYQTTCMSSGYIQVPGYSAL